MSTVVSNNTLVSTTPVVDDNAYVILYKTGGPDAFFWTKVEADDHVDRRNREIRKIVAVPKSKVYVQIDSKKRDLYYYYPDKDPNTVCGVYPSQAAVKRAVKLGVGHFLGNLSTKYWIP